MDDNFLTDIEQALKEALQDSISFGGEPVPVQVVTPDPDLARFEGLYRDRWGEYARVAVVGDILRVVRLEVENIDRATTKLDRLGPTTFRTHVDELNMGANVEDIIEFTIDSAGRPTSFTTEGGAYRYHRVE